MKITRLIKLIILFSFTISYAQTNTENYYNNLFYTCKVWGYLKYFHTSLAEGKINWDDFLINNLSKLKTVTTKNEFNDYLALYFNVVGNMQIPITDPPNVPEDLRYNLKTDWFINNSFSNNTTGILQDIQNKFRPRSNYYVHSIPEDGEPLFDFDKLYYTVTNTTEDQRVLGLFRYWNIINYFYPYKNLLDKNWDNVLKEMIPKIISCKDEFSYHYAILELATNLNDAHASFSYSSIMTNNIFGNYYLPIMLKYLNGNTIILKAGTNVSGLKPGDIIKKINGETIEVLRNKLRPIACGSNHCSIESSINSDLINFIENKPVTLEIENEKGVSQVSLPLVTSSAYWNSFTYGPPWSVKWKDGKKFGIINLEVLEDSQIPTVFSELWDCDALIFDIRSYPNVTIQYFLNYLYSNPIIIARFTEPDVTYPGTFVWSSEMQGTGDFSKNYNKRIYILFNEDAQSASEYDIMALEQHPKAVKVGSQTAGADGNVSYMYLPGRIVTWFTGLGTFYPDYRPTQRIGIVPDVNVLPTIQGIRDGKDEVLEAAINHYFGIADVEQENKIPADYSLSQNFPNPFNPCTTISYQLSAFSKVTLKVFDVLGREVSTLVNEYQQPGNFVKTFHGTSLPSGIYFYRLQVSDPSLGSGQGFTDSKKMLLIK